MKFTNQPYYTQIKYYIIKLVDNYNLSLSNYDTPTQELDNLRRDIDNAVREYNADSKLEHANDLQYPYCEIIDRAHGKIRYEFAWKFQ